MSDLEGRLETIVRASPRVMTVLSIARDLGLPDWLLVSGGVYQTVWNALTGRDPDYGIKDYDLCYFDASDTSYEAEDVHIRAAETVFPGELAAMVEVRNQARVHLWFEDHFGEPYTPLSCTGEALSRFVAPAFSVGVRLGADGRLSIAAPFGLEDVFAMRLAPNPNRPQARGWAKTTGSAKARWPEVTIIEPAA